MRAGETAVLRQREDRILDIWIDPDRSWRWLDEDELAEALRLGLVTPEEEAAATRAAGERVLGRLDELLPTGYEDWRPDPDWPVPTLPEQESL